MSDTAACCVASALSWVGTPYVHGASVKGVGCDCLGLLRGVWRDIRTGEAPSPPPYAAQWGEGFGEAGELLLDALACYLRRSSPIGAPGCVVAIRPKSYGPVKHCGIVTYDNRLIHSVVFHGVIISSLDAWKSRIVATFDW